MAKFIGAQIGMPCPYCRTKRPLVHHFASRACAFANCGFKNENVSCTIDTSTTLCLAETSKLWVHTTVYE